MDSTVNVFIIGAMGAGKSSIGLQLAKLLKLEFYDSDRELEKRSGVDIEWMFELEGEEGFRERECHIIEQLSQKKGIVLSTGGGVICSEKNRQLLSQRGVVVFLQVPFEMQLKRVNRIPERRPSLQVPNKEEKLRELNAERFPLYESIADLTYDNSTEDIHKLALRMFKDIKNYINNGSKS